MPNTCLTLKKRTYSSLTKYFCQKGTLPKEIEKSIPRSTRHTWREQSAPPADDSLLAEFETKGFDYALLFSFCEKEKALSTALTEIILLYQKIVGSDHVKKQLFAGNKTLVLETIDRLKHVLSLNKICGLLAISIQQYHSWKNNRDCQASLLKLCRKKFLTQLTDKDVKAVRDFKAKKAYAH